MISKKILVIHQGAIGDLVLSLPALQTIKQSCPGRTIEMLGYPGILSLISADIAGAIRSADGAQSSSLYGDFSDVSGQMRQYLEGFERIFVFSASRSSAFIENVQRCNAAAVHIKTFPDDSRHVVDFQLEQLAALGVATASPMPRLQVPSDDGKRAEMFLRLNGMCADAVPLIAVHPGSGGRHKCWPPEAFAAVMGRLHEEAPAVFLIVRGPADEQSAGELEDCLKGLPHKKLANLDLPLVAALLARCALFIGNDSGMSHAAAALGVPTVAVFGPTDPAVWSPRGKSVRIVRSVDQAGQWSWPKPEDVTLTARSLLSQC